MKKLIIVLVVLFTSSFISAQKIEIKRCNYKLENKDVEKMVNIILDTLFVESDSFFCKIDTKDTIVMYPTFNHIYDTSIFEVDSNDFYYFPIIGTDIKEFKFRFKKPVVYFDSKDHPFVTNKTGFSIYPPFINSSNCEVMILTYTSNRWISFYKKYIFYKNENGWKLINSFITGSFSTINIYDRKEAMKNAKVDTAAYYRLVEIIKKNIKTIPVHKDSIK